jgi:hypothetical protein
VSVKDKLPNPELEKAKELMVNVVGTGQAEDQGLVDVAFEARKFVSIAWNRRFRAST